MIRPVAISLLLAFLVSGCADEGIEEPVLTREILIKPQKHTAKSKNIHKAAQKKNAKSHKKRPIPTCANPVKKSVAKKTETAITPTTTSFAVFFEQRQAAFKEQSEPVLSSIIKTLAKEGSYIVVISDKSKAGKDDLALSLERMQAVKSRLVNGGIKESAIQIASKGNKGKNKVNHKVEIFLND